MTGTESERATRRRSAGRAAGQALPLVLTVSLIGCLHGQPTSETTPPRIVWPPPPASPRIEYSGSIRHPIDIGIRRGRLSRFFDRLAGIRRPTAMLRPYGITVAPGDIIVLADPGAHCVHLYDRTKPRYRRITTGGKAPLLSPIGVAADDRGGIYVADSFRRVIFRYDTDGEFVDTLGRESDLIRPTGLAFDPRRKRLYVVDTGGHRVVGFDGDGTQVVSFGQHGAGEGQFNYPVAVAVDADGNLYVTDAMNFRVQVLDPDGRFVRAFGKPGNGGGDFDKAKGIALDSDGHVYVVEGLHDVIHVYDDAGQLLTVLGGTGTDRGQFWLPTGIHIDAAGRILISDSANRRVQILRYLGAPADGDLP